MFWNFSQGVASLSRAFVKHGFSAEAWDIQYNSGCNLGDPQVLDNIVSRIRNHEFVFVHLGTPCTSWSLARRNDGGPAPLRDDGDGLFGLPGLSAADQRRVDNGNLMLNISAIICKTCVECNVAVSLENPASSRLWLTNEIATLQKSGAVFQNTTFCAFGTPWQKATSFLTFNCPSFKFKLCNGPFCKCDFSGRPHVALSGKNKAGQWKTRVAQPYPVHLCHTIASSFLPGQ